MDFDVYYDQYMEEDSVYEFLETIVYVARQHAKFMKETNHMSMENYEEVKDRILLRPAEGGTRIIREGREKREPVPRKKYVTEEFPYFQGMFYVDFHNSDGWCIGVPVEEEHLKKWGRTKKDLLAAALKNQLNDKIVLAPFEDIIAAEKEDWEEVDADKEVTESTTNAEQAGTEEDTGEAGQEESRYKNYWTESIASEEVRSAGLLVLTNNYQNGGAALILNPEILRKLRQILGSNYYILLSSTEEVWIMADTKDVDYETVMKTIPGADGSDVPKGILTGELLYYDVEAGRIVTAREYKKPEGGAVRQLA